MSTDDYSLDESATNPGDPPLPTLFDPSNLIKKGLVTVSKTRPPGPHRQYFELHGDKNPKHRLAFIMGLNNSCFGWSNQIDRLSKLPGYQCLAIDNRGVSNSDSPKGRYKTSEMAVDVREILDVVGWTDKRSVHVIGVSMGGMIAQHLCLQVPERIVSLTLLSTKSGYERDPPPLRGLIMFARLITGAVKSEKDAVLMVANTLFPAEFLDAPDPEDPSKPRRERFERDFLRRFSTARRQTTAGRFGQLAAALTHRVSPKQLAQIARDVPKVSIITGDDDNLVRPSRSLDLHRYMPGSSYHLFKGGGHALPSQSWKELNELIVKTVEEGEAKL